MFCAECDRLLTEYAGVTIAHADACALLADGVEISEASEFVALRNAATELRIHLEASRDALQSHGRRCCLR
jgi:hypothetical protein